MSKIKQTKIPVTLTEDLIDLRTQAKPNWKLIRERDGLTKHSVDVMWIEFNDEGRFKSKHDEPAVGRSLMMSPFTFSFTWQTTDITEIVEQRENYIKFNTRNSVYELFHLK